ncbi:MAG: hypothetical protein U1E48_08420 [Paracoccaceae bacterium]
MADGTHDINGAAAGVPVDHVLRTRRDFPGCRLSYEIQIEGAGWRGLAALAEACDAAGLELLTLRCHASGTIFCALGDDGSADLGLLARRLGQAGVLAGWTTLVLYQDRG